MLQSALQSRTYRQSYIARMLGELVIYKCLLSATIYNSELIKALLVEFITINANCLIFN
jgi:hypothetical protein